ncbi:hypothetical protein [Anaerococcus sp. Marseille-Q5996]|nr:hypothetical protein [Anaerococcus sp. Marseille-Q5996]
MKLYLVIERNDGASGLWGEYVSLCGIYTDADRPINEFLGGYGE